MMTRTWPEIRRHYAEGPPLDWTNGMLALIDYISESPLAIGLFAWTSMLDLCIAQVPATHPYNGPYLRISPIQGGRLEFRYFDTMVRRKQWSREVEAADAVRRFNLFISQLCWSTVPTHES